MPTPLALHPPRLQDGAQLFESSTRCHFCFIPIPGTVSGLPGGGGGGGVRRVL
jgi:hypothetical protein